MVNSFKGGQAQDVSYVLGSGQMIPEFDKLIVGMKKGEQKLDTITFPTTILQKSFPARLLNLILSKECRRGELPKIDEKFAKQFGIEDGSIDKLEKEVEKNLKRKLSPLFIKDEQLCFRSTFAGKRVRHS